MRGVMIGCLLGLTVALAAPTDARAASTVSTTTALAAPAAKAGLPKPGQRGTKVRALQRRLVALGLLHRVTGTYRRGTVRAVKRFQRRQGVRVTGKVNARTWRLLVAATTKRPTPRPPASLPPAPLVVAHRGARVAGIGESTMAAMRYAAEGGAKVLEFDVRWTADNVPVVMHDQDVAGTTACTGGVTTYTWLQLTTRCLIPSRPVPMVAEVVGYARDQGLAISPEIKKATPTAAQAAGLVALFDGSPTYLQSFHAGALVAMRTAGYTGQSVYLTEHPETPQDIRATGATIVSQRISSLLTPQLVSTYRGAGLQVWAWTATSTAQYAQVRALGADAIVADDAPAALRFYAAQG